LKRRERLYINDCGVKVETESGKTGVCDGHVVTVIDKRRRFICTSGAILVAMVCAAPLVAVEAEPAPGVVQAAAGRPRASGDCAVDEVTHEGLPAVRITNHWVELILVPKLGGRLMQVRFAGHAYLFENPQLKGKYFPPLGPGDSLRWYNYGGDKTWPLPEGNQDQQHWPGPIADALDDGDYKPTVVSLGPRCIVRMDGPADQRTGLQYSREISLGDSPEIWFHAVMKNASSHPIQWSMQSVTQYDTSGADGDFNHNFWAFTPANPQSAYLDGFHVRSGVAEDPSFSVTGGLFRLHWLYLQSEVWIDSSGDWLAVVDHGSGYAMVERFHYQSGAEYPGLASVIFYKNGPTVEMNDRGRPEIRTSADDAPFYMEAELNSPMAKLAPGETYAMDTKWYPTRSAAEFAGVAESGVIGKPLVAVRGATGVRISGSFGVFFAGRLVAHFLGASGAELGSLALLNTEPAEVLDLDEQVKAPAGTERVRISIESQQGENHGVLGEAAVTENS
jgi:hypothetical protein